MHQPEITTRLQLVLHSKSNDELRTLVRKRNQYVFFGIAPGVGFQKHSMKWTELQHDLDQMTKKGYFPSYSRWKIDTNWIDPSSGKNYPATHYKLFIYPMGGLLALGIDDTIEPGRPKELILEQQLEKL